MAIDGQVCFHRSPSSRSYQTMKVHYRAYVVGSGTNKDMSSAKLLATTVSAYAVDYVRITELLHLFNYNEVL